MSIIKSFTTPLSFTLAFSRYVNHARQYKKLTPTDISLLYRVYPCGYMLNYLSDSLIHRITTTSSLLFPVLTISPMTFHIMIACIMAMKYLCDKKRLYLVPITFAFACSAMLMLGTIGGYSN